MLLGTLGSRLLANILAGKEIVRAVKNCYGNIKGGGILRAGHRNKMDF